MNLYKYIKQENSIIKCYYSIALLLSLFFITSIFHDILQVHIYRHDSIYYMIQNDYLRRVPTEGRWLNYIFFPLVKIIPGSLWSIFILTSFLYFIFYSAYKWTQNIYYSILLSLLFIQIPSFYGQIQWPATTAPTFFILLFAIYLVNRLPIFLFYNLFGVLFFATMSNYYYLLPMLHLPLLIKGRIKEKMRLVFLKIMPYWAIGFIVGSVVTELIIYLWFGHFVKLQSWRNPHYIHSLYDIMNNIQLSFKALPHHIQNIFSNIWMVVTGTIGLIISLWSRRKDLIFLPLLIFCAIILVHYIVIIPVGINISLRTIVATWIGIFAIIFFIPLIEQWKVFLLTPIIIFFTYNLYLRNHTNLQWYGTVTNTYYNMLQKVSPMAPKLYKGVVLFASNKEIQKINKYISKEYGLHKDSYIEGLGSFMRWAAIAKEAGFKHIVKCDKTKNSTALWDYTINANLVCQKLSTIYTASRLSQQRSYGILNIAGAYNDLLVLSFNKCFIKK